MSVAKTRFEASITVKWSGPAPVNVGRWADISYAEINPLDAECVAGFSVEFVAASAVEATELATRWASGQPWATLPILYLAVEIAVAR